METFRDRALMHDKHRTIAFRRLRSLRSSFTLWRERYRRRVLRRDYHEGLVRQMEAKRAMKLKSFILGQWMWLASRRQTARRLLGWCLARRWKTVLSTALHRWLLNVSRMRSVQHSRVKEEMVDMMEDMSRQHMQEVMSLLAFYPDASTGVPEFGTWQHARDEYEAARAAYVRPYTAARWLEQLANRPNVVL